MKSPKDEIIPSSSTYDVNGVVEEEIKLTVPTKIIFKQIKDDPHLIKKVVNGWYKRQELTIYFDTSDRYLLKQRLALRLRKGESDSYILGLKGFGSTENGVAKRLEWEQRLTNPPNNFYSGLHYSDIVPGLVKDRLDGLIVNIDRTSDFSFLPLLESDIKRETCLLDLGGGTRVEIALDWGVVRANGRNVEIGEIEVEKISGSSEVIELFARDIAKRYSLKLSEHSKFSLGLSLY
ncbi:MAG: CYTH domain-containing protein [Magnetococcales bacterium]|nr:CYTH domain-containing protein [Magnetococcales bacterium]